MIYRSAPAWSLRRRGLADTAGAAADALRAQRLYDGLPTRSGGEWFETVCCHAALAGLAGRDSAGISADAASSHAETALALFKKAVGMGYRDADMSAPSPLSTRSATAPTSGF